MSVMHLPTWERRPRLVDFQGKKVRGGDYSGLELLLGEDKLRHSQEI